VECTRLMLEAGAEPNARNGQGGTALHRAIDLRSLEVVELLLDAGAVVGEHREGMIETAQAYPEIAALLEAAP